MQQSTHPLKRKTLEHLFSHPHPFSPTTSQSFGEPPVPLATIYSPDDAPLDTDPDKSDHHARTPMSSSVNTSASGSSSSPPPHIHNRDGNHPHPLRERGDRDHRSTTPVRLGMGVSEKTISTMGTSMTPTRFEHTQSEHTLLSGSSASNTTSQQHHSHNHNMITSKSYSKHQPNQSNSSQIYSSSSSSSSSKNSNNNYHNHSLTINHSNSNSSSNLHSYQIGDDSLSTHLLGTAIPSSSSASPDANDTASVGGSLSQSSPLGRAKRRSMSHSDLPSLSDVALAASSSASASTSNYKEATNVGGSAVAVGAASALLNSSSSTRGSGLGLYSAGGTHAGSKQHLIDVNWSVDPLSSSSSAAAAAAAAAASVTSSMRGGTVPVTHTPQQLNSLHALY